MSSRKLAKLEDIISEIVITKQQLYVLHSTVYVYYNVW